MSLLSLGPNLHLKLVKCSGRTAEVDQELSAWVGNIRRQDNDAVRQLRRVSGNRSMLIT